MGFLTDYVIKDERQKKIAFWIRDIIILGIFAYLALTHRNTWQAGYKYCSDRACVVCWDITNTTPPPFGAEVGGWDTPIVPDRDETNLTNVETIETAGKGASSSLPLDCLTGQSPNLKLGPSQSVSR